MGRGHRGFCVWAAAFALIAVYRIELDAVSCLGDWSPMVDDLDAYRDGCAGLKVGQYMASLLDNMSQSCNSADAIRWAKKEFIRCGGADAVETHAMVS